MRLFVALDLPDEVVAALSAWASEAARPGLRILPPSSYHVTLAFLGERPEGEADAIGAAVLAAAAAAPAPASAAPPAFAPIAPLSLAEPAWLGRRSVLAVDLRDPSGALAALQRRISGALAALGAYTPEERPFRPHVTLARVRRGARPDPRRLPDAPHLQPFAATAVTLYRSTLSPQGASYAPLARAELPRP